MLFANQDLKRCCCWCHDGVYWLMDDFGPYCILVYLYTLHHNCGPVYYGCVNLFLTQKKEELYPMFIIPINIEPISEQIRYVRLYVTSVRFFWLSTFCFILGEKLANKFFSQNNVKQSNNVFDCLLLFKSMNECLIFLI